MSLDLPILMHHYERLDSTSTWARLHYTEHNIKRLNLVTASEQTHGKGSHGKSWSSPKDMNIYATFFFSTPHSSLNLCNLAQILSLTIARHLTTLGFNPTIKWPNDLFLENKKIGGILCEILPINDQFLVILGFGLNVNMPKSLCQEIDQPTTSLFISNGQILDTQKLVKDLGKDFQKDLLIYLKKDFAYFSQEYNSYMIYRNKPVFFQNTYLGLSKQVNTKGELEILTPNNILKAISNGSIKIHH